MLDNIGFLKSFLPSKAFISPTNPPSEREFPFNITSPFAIDMLVKTTPGGKTDAMFFVTIEASNLVASELLIILIL